MKNQLQIDHCYFSSPDHISVRLNDQQLYQGSADLSFIDFEPVIGQNILQVILDKKQDGNFHYDATTDSVIKNSMVKIKELIVQDRYFRSLTIKCGLVEVDLCKNIHFPSKYIDHENCLTMEGSIYLIKFDVPIKNWMQIHLHKRDLDKLTATNQKVKAMFANR